MLAWTCWLQYMYNQWLDENEIMTHAIWEIINEYHNVIELLTEKENNSINDFLAILSVVIFAPSFGIVLFDLKPVFHEFVF